MLNVASVQKGECPISLVYDFDGFAKRDATGLPLQVIIPKDGTVGMLFAQYSSAKAPHPNAAKLAINSYRMRAKSCWPKAMHIHRAP